jgi:hypothetical protein
MGGDRFPNVDTPVGAGDDVVVVGAGNTAMDCLRVAMRLGAKRVRCVYRRSRAEAPARAEELRHAEEEGVEMLFLHAPVEVLTTPDGTVRGMVLAHMELGEPDERGRRRPVASGVQTEIECDTVIVASAPTRTRSSPATRRGCADCGVVAADPISQATSLPGVFAGGDIVTGGATVILAMGAGRRAAEAIMEYLRTGAARHIDTGSEAVCPRCRRPMDDGDEGICCADSLLAWKCTECDKRSEGFAFPYGRCMACGGELDLVDPPAVNDQVRDAIRKAFEIELGGRDFYVAAAQHTTDDALRDTFGAVGEDGGRAYRHTRAPLPPAPARRRRRQPAPGHAAGRWHPRAR